MVRKSGKPDLRRRISANPALRSASRKIATNDSALASTTYKYNLVAKLQLLVICRVKMQPAIIETPVLLDWMPVGVLARESIGRAKWASPAEADMQSS